MVMKCSSQNGELKTDEQENDRFSAHELVEIRVSRLNGNIIKHRNNLSQTQPSLSRVSARLCCHKLGSSHPPDRHTAPTSPC